LPYKKPSPQGTKHCQGYEPEPGDVKENLSTLCGDFSVQGAALHRFALALLPTSGTLIPRVGMEKVCPTPLPAFEL